VQILNNQNIKQNFGKEISFVDFSKLIRWIFSCQGKSTCQILIDNQIFTDPCGLNIAKHFEVHYRCIDKGKRFFLL